MSIPLWAFYTIFMLVIVLLVYQLHRVMEDDANPIQWWQFISSIGKDGKPYADLTKLGQAAGIITCMAVVIIFSARVKDLSWEGFAAVLTIVLLYLGGVQGYQAYMKSRTSSPEKKEGL
jgi:hypothetical protein